MACTKTKPDYFVGIDLHKKFMQVAIMDPEGEIVEDKKINCDHNTITREFSRLPENCRYVMESSSVWYGMYRLLSDKLKLDVVLSNPYKTRIIAESKKKTRWMPGFLQTCCAGDTFQSAIFQQRI